MDESSQDRRERVRRDDDREWQRQVDHQLVTAMTAMQVVQDQLREVRDQLRDMEITLHGEKKNSGLISEYERHDYLLTRLNSVIFQDFAGKTGALRDIAELKSGEHRAEYKLKFWAPVLAAFITSAGAVAVATNWGRIINFIRPRPQAPAPHRPRVMVRHYTIHAKPEDPESE